MSCDSHIIDVSSDLEVWNQETAQTHCTKTFPEFCNDFFKETAGFKTNWHITTRGQQCAKCYIFQIESKSQKQCKADSKDSAFRNTRKEQLIAPGLLHSHCMNRDGILPAGVNNLNKRESEVREIKWGIHLHCSSWLWIKIHRLFDTYRVSPSLCVHALASPVVTDLAVLWAVSQNSIINVWIDLLAGISWGWLWGCCTVCCESDVLATFRHTRAITGSSKAFKSCWIDQGAQWDVKYTHPDKKAERMLHSSSGRLWG